MRLAYFDCFSGISGNMALSALVHAGADLEAIGESLDALPTIGFVLEREEVEVHGIAAVRVRVKVIPQGVIRTYASIRSLLEKADLPERARWTAQRIFHRLAQADAKVHNREPDVVTFHEGGEDDSLVDVLGCTLALEMLGVERVFASAVPTGLGMVRTEHGLMPVPSPVVLEILQGVPTYSRGIPAELVTPTGAAILTSLAEGYGDMPLMVAEQVGYGAGALRLDFPNTLRVVIGEGQLANGAARAGAGGTEADVLIEANLRRRDALGGAAGDDDIDRELVEELIRAGASDAWITRVVGRAGPGSRISIVASSASREALVARVRTETSGPIAVAPFGGLTS